MEVHQEISAENTVSLNQLYSALVVKMDGTESKTQSMERSVSVVTDSFSIHYQDHTSFYKREKGFVSKKGICCVLRFRKHLGLSRNPEPTNQYRATFPI